MISRQSFLIRLPEVLVVILALCPVLTHARVSSHSGLAWIHIEVQNLTDQGSTAGGVSSGEATIFSHGPETNLTSALCGDDKSASDYVFLGEHRNGRTQAVNVSTADGSRHVKLWCTFYIVVGRTYLYCSSRELSKTENCGRLQDCSSRIIALVCDKTKQCEAWCDASSDVTVDNGEDGEGKGGQGAPVKVTHHLGHDVIGVIAGCGALAALILVCCIVDRVRRSKYYILRYAGRRKKDKTADLNTQDMKTKDTEVKDFKKKDTKTQPSSLDELPHPVILPDLPIKSVSNLGQGHGHVTFSCNVKGPDDDEFSQGHACVISGASHDGQ